MNDKEATRVIAAIARWMELREQGGYGAIATPGHFLIEAEHSLRGGLLERLLINEKEPLEHTPPLAFSRPWYSLIESGETVVEKMFVYKGIKEDTVAICQHQWQIVSKEADGFIVCWRPEKTGVSHWGQWRLTETPDSWILCRMG